MLSLNELRRVAAIFDGSLRGHRVERWVQPDATSVAVSIYGRDAEHDEGRKRTLLFCCEGELARVSEIDRLPKAPERPPAFSSYLRAHLSRAVIKGARLVDDDRQLAVRMSAREGEFDLLLALFGNRSNLYLLGASGEVLQTLRPLPDTRPELKMGEPYHSPGSAAPRVGADRFEDADAAHYLLAIETHYGPRGGRLQQGALARELSQVLKREQKNARRRLDKIEGELAEADLADEYARHGELLKGALGRITQGDSEITLQDYETGEDVVIPLDSKKSPKGNLDATFKRYQKLLRRLAKAGGQVDEAREWIEFVKRQLEQVRVFAEAEDGLAGLQAIADLEPIRKLLKKRAAATQTKAPEQAQSSLPARLQGVPTRLLPRRYRSRDGLEIWVGRSDAGNDHLTTRLARGNDLFFHVEASPGSHVILRTEGKTDPPQESVLDACELAVRFSKQKGSLGAQVHVVPIKNVSKPKGAKPGLVYVTGGKTVSLRREEERLKRLLDSKID
ncbi:MAG: DUF814 domain-containing protein [bacterium]|nr:DUF814 domain-containing protein [bacterium]